VKLNQLDGKINNMRENGSYSDNHSAKHS